MLKLVKILPLLSGVSITPIIATAVVPTVNMVKSSTFDENDDFKVLKNLILKNKQYLKEQEYINFKDEQFSSYNELVDYLIQNKLIQKEFSSSNPNKILKNQDQLLDEKQIYDLNPNNFISVYRNSHGDISYSLKDALNTYVNKGNVSQQYSYNKFDWYLNPYEAEQQARNQQSVTKSLYYLYNSQYFNAFNKQDNSALFNLLKSGVYIKKDKDLSGTYLPEPETIYGDFDVVRSIIKEKLESEWYKTSYLNKISTVKNDFILNYGPDIDSYQFKVVYLRDLNDSSRKHLPTKDYNFGQTAVLKFHNNFANKEELLSWFLKPSNWQTKWEKFNDGVLWSTHKKYFEREVQIEEDKTVYSVALRLVPKWDVNWSEDFQDPNPYTDFHSVVEEVTDYKFYYNSEKKKDEIIDAFYKKDLDTIQELPNGVLSNIYNLWFDHYFNNLIDFGTNTNTRFSYEDLINNNLIKSSNNLVDPIGDVYKDMSYEINYGKGYNESIIQTYSEWLNDKNQILAKPILVDGKLLYPLSLSNDESIKDSNTMMNVTREQLDNFLPLYGNIPFKILYSYSDLQDVSDRWGTSLYASELEAQQMKLLMYGNALSTRFVIYDDFGNEQVSHTSIEHAVDLMKKRLMVLSKMINRDEISSWINKDYHRFDDVVSDGVYEVYTIRNEFANGAKLYYATQKAAIQAVTSEIINNEDYNKELKSLYLYQYEDKQGIKKNISFTMDEIDQVTSTVLEQIADDWNEVDFSEED